MLNLKNANVKKLLICYLGLLLMVSRYANACTSDKIQICLSEHGHFNGELACWIKAADIADFSVNNLGPHFSNYASGARVTLVGGGNISGTYSLKLCRDINLEDCHTIVSEDYVGDAHNDRAKGFKFHCDS